MLETLHAYIGMAAATVCFVRLCFCGFRHARKILQNKDGTFAVDMTPKPYPATESEEEEEEDEDYHPTVRRGSGFKILGAAVQDQQAEQPSPQPSTEKHESHHHTTTVLEGQYSVPPVISTKVEEHHQVEHQPKPDPPKPEPPKAEPSPQPVKKEPPKQPPPPKAEPSPQPVKKEPPRQAPAPKQPQPQKQPQPEMQHSNPAQSANPPQPTQKHHNPAEAASKGHAVHDQLGNPFANQPSMVKEAAPFQDAEAPRPGVREFVPHTQADEHAHVVPVFSQAPTRTLKARQWPPVLDERETGPDGQKHKVKLADWAPHMKEEELVVSDPRYAVQHTPKVWPPLDEAGDDGPDPHRRITTKMEEENSWIQVESVARLNEEEKALRQQNAQRIEKGMWPPARQERPDGEPGRRQGGLPVQWPPAEGAEHDVERVWEVPSPGKHIKSVPWPPAVPEEEQPGQAPIPRGKDRQKLAAQWPPEGSEVVENGMDAPPPPPKPQQKARAR